MEEFDWWGILLCFVGMVYILASTYKWEWSRFNNWGHRIEWKKARPLNLACGFGVLGIGIGFTILEVSSTAVFTAYVCGFILSAVATKLIYESREGQSIGELIQFKGERKPKSKHGEEE